MSLAITQQNLIHSGIRKFSALTDRSNNSTNSFSGCTNRTHQSLGDNVTFTGVPEAGNKVISTKLSHSTKVSFRGLNNASIVAYLKDKAWLCKSGSCGVNDHNAKIVVANEQIQKYLPYIKGHSLAELAVKAAKLKAEGIKKVHSLTNESATNHTLSVQLKAQAKEITDGIGINTVQTAKHNGHSFLLAANKTALKIGKNLSGNTPGVKKTILTNTTKAFNNLSNATKGHKTLLTNTTKAFDNLSAITANGNKTISDVLTIHIHIPSQIADLIHTYFPDILANLHLINLIK